MLWVTILQQCNVVKKMEHYDMQEQNYSRHDPVADGIVAKMCGLSRFCPCFATSKILQFEFIDVSFVVFVTLLSIVVFCHFVLWEM